MAITPREYQTQAVDGIFRFFTDFPDDRHPLVLMPTGTGKSIVIGSFIQRSFQYWHSPNYTPRIWAVTHVKELIEQNAGKLRDLWLNAPFGIVSAGLDRRDLHAPIIFGGVKTLANVADQMEAPDIFWIDEAHLLSPNAETMYQQLIARLKARKPHMKVAGCTATGFRLGQGMLTEGPTAVFTDIAVDQTSMEWWNYFMLHGFLVPPRPRRTQAKLNMATVGISNGDYKLGEMQAACDTADLNYRVCYEMLSTAYQEQRHRGLVFCSGVDHAEHIAEQCTKLGREAHAIHIRTGDKKRNELLRAHKAGEFPIITNNNVLTVGYDDPAIDWIGGLRPTVSTSLWVQMLGRGTRPYPGKKDCLVMDFAQNTPRLGPINDPWIPQLKKKGDGEAPVKVCECCGNYCHASVRTCPWCGNLFEFEVKIFATPNVAEMFRGDVPEYKYFDIMNTWFTPHEARSGRRSIRVQYQCGSKQFSEYIDFESSGFRQHIAHEFWRRFANADELPADNDAALDYLRRHHAELNMPKRVKVHINRAYPEIVGYEHW